METVYIRLRHRVRSEPNTIIYIEDIAEVVASVSTKESINKQQIYQLKKEDHSHVIIDVIHVIAVIKEANPQLEITMIGPEQTIIEIQLKKKKRNPLLFPLAWFLLFVGSSLAIMYFHEDVSMGAVHERIYFMLTGEHVKQPLLFQVPYSIGLGIGMMLFFNHIFKNRINEEPSPLEVEMHQYQKSIDDYMIYYENKENVNEHHESD